MIEPWIWPAALGVLGLIFGSFIATVALRWPEGRSALRGRSQCDSCHKVLRAHELVPLLSYALQRGRCRSCGSTIHPGHLAVEIAGMLVGIAAGLVAPGWHGVAGAVFGWLLLALALRISGRETGQGKITMTSRLPLGTLLAVAAFPAWLYATGV